jgi:ceramide glucosyltransferase
MAVFYFFAAIVIGLGVLSLRGGIRFRSFICQQEDSPPPDYYPFLSIVVPCRGIDEGLRENLAALFQQDYPAYEIIFVADSVADPALNVIRELIRGLNSDKQVATRVVVAGEATDSGQKVHNLRTAVSEIDPRSEVLVFVDTDARTPSSWLKTLLAPLANEAFGAATGYRWFIPARFSFASQLRSVWNASIASSLGNDHYANFCWGGSTAIRRTTFDALNIRERWLGTVSDDFTVTRVLQEARLPIRFVPQCLIPTLDDCTGKELLEFTNRQLQITRVYAPHLWRSVLIGSLLFCGVFFGGLVLVTVRLILGLPYALPMAALALVFLLGAAKALIRLQAVAGVIKGYEHVIWKSLPAHLLLWPFASALFLLNALVALFTRRIKWRGITYELKSASEAVIISREM